MSTQKKSKAATADEALQRLIDGNKRFSQATKEGLPLTGTTAGGATDQEQQPFAIILGCSDARVPAEIVFDQGIGDLFVIRVAGNIVAPSQVGSIEFAAEVFGAKLVVVLGHSHCGAVKATLEELERPSHTRSRNLASIVNRIRPAVETLFESSLRSDPEALIKHSVRANVRASTSHLRQGSEVLENLIENGGLRVVGAEYSLETGLVEFFDLPAAD
jgi:carbonic anhydrase